MPRTFKFLSVIGLSFLAFDLGATTQQQRPVSLCPAITVDCPTQPVEQGRLAVVSVDIAGGPLGANLTYEWSAAGGQITGGQGAPSITVEYRDVECLSSKVTVKVGGLDASCRNTASCSLEIDMGHPPLYQFDQYGPISPEAEQERLNNYAIQLENSPGTVGYIVFNTAQRADARKGRSRAVRAMNYLIRKKKIDPKRLFINSGQLEWDAIELWVVSPASKTKPGYKILSPPPNFKVWYPKCI
jgi:hypothetical protein